MAAPPTWATLTGPVNGLYWTLVQRRLRSVEYGHGPRPPRAAPSGGPRSVRDLTLGSVCRAHPCRRQRSGCGARKRLAPNGGLPRNGPGQSRRVHRWSAACAGLVGRTGHRHAPVDPRRRAVSVDGRHAPSRQRCAPSADRGLARGGAADRASYERVGTRSHLSIPLQAGGPMLGVLSFDSVRAERDWPDELVDRLRLLSEAFAGALERKRMELALAERLRFQRLLSDLSVRFANVPALDFDQAVHGALRSIVDFLGVDRAALIAFPTRGGAEASWSVDGATDMSRLSWLMPRLQSGDVVRVSPPAELPDGMKDLVALPLRSGGVILGGLVVATVGAGRAWSDELLEQLHLVGETVANALAAGQAERESGRLRQELAHIGRVS